MTEKNELDYINVAKKNGCTLIFNPRLSGHTLHYGSVSEYIPNIGKRSIEQFDKYCKEFIKRNGGKK